MTVKKEYPLEVDDAENAIRELQIVFKKIGWTNKDDLNKFEGTIPVRPGSEKNWRVYGKWNEHITAYNEETEEEMEIWRPNEMPENSDWMYHMTKFATDLNHLAPNFQEYLPPTDTRLRPD